MSDHAACKQRRNLLAATAIFEDDQVLHRLETELGARGCGDGRSCFSIPDVLHEALRDECTRRHGPRSAFIQGLLVFCVQV